MRRGGGRRTPGGTAADPVLDAPASPITVRQRLDHTSGLAYGLTSDPVDTTFAAARLYARAGGAVRRWREARRNARRPLERAPEARRVLVAHLPADPLDGRVPASAFGVARSGPQYANTRVRFRSNITVAVSTPSSGSVALHAKAMPPKGADDRTTPSAWK